ncbi:unnamed protein product (mitochondrion) [Plasmodiophora brassicae]|uniref:Protein farnesyltransferase subunit beta n=1 Tax=Plasmodiophora brassicae TaxID=37360 RepID=A0A0G4IKD8_PLABS|nr:hypothetical protein PBRA_004273 [Plasmodiophora brassicae]SPR00421.1 unnamed protein product [Plasmodiophora brassicae]
MYIPIKQGGTAATMFATVAAERAVQEDIVRLLADNAEVPLHRTAHTVFCLSSAHALPSWATSLDASRPWLCFWIVHSLALLDQMESNADLMGQVARFLATCQSVTGGFGGGPGQIPHLAPTYAAVMTLAEIGTREAWDVIDRAALHRFLLSRKHPSGGFTMHDQGEIDIRGAYCALAAANLCAIASDDLRAGVGDWLRSCQTFEGGFGGEPGNEAHGGYAFCGVAALLLLGELDATRARRVLRWAVHRQMTVAGGFQGRTNKLVDSCYSYWVGGIMPLVDLVLGPAGVGHWLYNEDALRDYIVGCCQAKGGGLKDKPGKHADLYHTCYALSGLSLAQHQPDSERHRLCSNNPLFNVVDRSATRALEYFASRPVL